mmetsp:Transcript_6533/g.16145  ORF Transcript_6533/g.16145 Transcript_6533/m.16145 type:complete len:233 (-) Transcript_6533:1170-1868(-)
MHPTVGPAHSEQRAAHDAVGVPMDEVVAGVGAVDGEASDRVGEREELCGEGLERLRHPRHVPDEERAAGHAVEDGAPLQQPQQHGGPYRQEDVERGVEQHEEVEQRRAAGVGRGGGGQQRRPGGGARRGAEHGDGEHDVERGEDPRDRALEDARGPVAPLPPQPTAGGRVARSGERVSNDSRHGLQMARVQPCQRLCVLRHQARINTPGRAQGLRPGARSGAKPRPAHPSAP